MSGWRAFKAGRIGPSILNLGGCYGHAVTLELCLMVCLVLSGD